MGTFLFITWLVFPVSTDDMNTDSKGLFYNMSPFLPEKGTIHIYTNPWLGYSKRPGPLGDTSRYIPNEPRNLPPDRHYYGTGTVGLGYTMLPQLQIFIGTYLYGNYIDRRPYPLYRSDTRYVDHPQILTAVKTAFPANIDSYVLSFGFVLWYAHWVPALSSGTPHISLQKEFIDCPTLAQDGEVGIRGITGIKSPIGTTFLNLGYFRIMQSTGQRGFNSYGIGQEIDLWHYIHPAIEIAKQDTFGSITPQVKILLPHFTINFGVGFPMSSEFDWVPNDTLAKNPKFMFSLSPEITIKRIPPPEPTIVIKGRVYDSLSTLPLRATITFIGPLSGQVKTKNGEYELKFVNAGAYRVGIESDDYWWEDRTFDFMAYDTVLANWPLMRKVTWSITGKILDKKTKAGVPAHIRLTGKDKAETYSDPLSGEYRIWVHKGEYDFCISAEGYHTEKIKVRISDKKGLHKDIYLLSDKYTKGRKPPKGAKPPGKKGKRRPKKK